MADAEGTSGTAASGNASGTAASERGERNGPKAEGTIGIA